MPDFGAENAVRQIEGWPVMVAVCVGECDHCPGYVWERVDKAFMCLACGCLRSTKGRESYCRLRKQLK